MTVPTPPRPAVIITGAAGGIGQALVRAFEGGGWRVISTDRVPLARDGHMVGDLSTVASPGDAAGEALVEALRMASGGALKALVHNAAHQVVKPGAEIDPADWQMTLGVNLLAPFWLSRAFLTELEANRGSILAVSSIHAALTKPGFVAYATSKAALSGMVRALAVDLGSKVRCNAIAPAAIATPMLTAGFADRPAALRCLMNHHPAGRIGTPEDVAAAALFLCSDAAGFMTGACLDLSGGIHARLHDPV
jgi:NAD(P)-dependent dehydrogenase (short-subunit alcohol dehydrogenase family)